MTAPGSPSRRPGRKLRPGPWDILRNGQRPRARGFAAERDSAGNSQTHGYVCHVRPLSKAVQARAPLRPSCCPEPKVTASDSEGGEVLALPAAALPFPDSLSGTRGHKILPGRNKGLGRSTLGPLLWDFQGARGRDSTACPRLTASPRTSRTWPDGREDGAREQRCGESSWRQPTQGPPQG